MFNNALSSLDLLNGWMDLNKICKVKSLGDGKQLNHQKSYYLGQEYVNDLRN